MSSLFLICTEVLAIALQNNHGIEGIPINEILRLLSQYADDMDATIIATDTSIKNLFMTIGKFRFQLGFIGWDYMVYRMGSIRNSNARFYVSKKLHWTNDPVNILGVMVHYDMDWAIELNYQPLIAQSKQTLNTWKNRNVSLLGKILLVNTMIASLFIYKMKVLGTLPDRINEQMNELIMDYLWDSGRPKIATKILQNTEVAGGANLINLKVKDPAVKLTWIKQIQLDIHMAETVYSYINKDLKELIWECHLSPTDAAAMNINNPFWKDVLLAWCQYNYKQPVLCQDTILWWNSHIRIANKLVFWKKPF